MIRSSIAPGIPVTRRPSSWEVGADADEDERLAILRSYGILDTDSEELFDSLTELAAEICGTSMAIISLVDRGRQWFKAKIGLDACETSRADSFCAHALHRPDPLIVPDAHLDVRFASNPLVLGPPFIRFYAGAPLVTPEGFTLGTLCVLDERPGNLTPKQTKQLMMLAHQVMGQLTSRLQADQLASEIAARRTSEAALAANDRLLRGVLSHPDAVIYAKDLDGKYVMANDSLRSLMNVGEVELIGRTDYDFVPPAVADVFRSNDMEVSLRGERIVVEETFPSREGKIRHYVSTKFPLRDENGQIYAVAGVSTDVTAQWEAQAKLQESERRWRQLFDESPVGIGLSDEHGVIVSANPELCALYGRPANEVIGHNAMEFSHPDDLLDHKSARSLLKASGGEIVQIEKRYVHPDGQVRWAWVTMGSTPGPDGQTWTLSHVQDTTERLATEQAVRDSEANLSAVAEVVKQIQSGDDARQTIVMACAKLAQATFVSMMEPNAGGNLLQVTTTNAVHLAGLSVPQRATSDTWRAFTTGESVFIAAPGDNVSLQNTPGMESTRTACVIPVIAGDTPVAVLAVAWDAEIAEENDKRIGVVKLLADQAGVALRQSALLGTLEKLAVTDTLTGLPNRRGWDQALTHMMNTRRAGDRVVVALIDFDYFKVYNDTCGHNAGDDLLRDFANRARSALRSGDVLARWGGEEFALALPNCRESDTDKVLGRIADAMPDGQTCSIGYAELAAGEDLAQAMVEADTALYVAKNNGRNQIRHFEVTPVP